MSTRISVSVSAKHHVLERSRDEHAVVDVDLDEHVLWQRGLDFREPLLDRARGGQHVRLRLRNDRHRKSDGAVRARKAAIVVGGEAHFGHFTETYEITVGATADDEIAEVLLVRRLVSVRSENSRSRDSSRPAGQFHVLTQQ
jgi:hypothetical protein